MDSNINRQYIGARYVPKFATPIEWNSALSYEPLTIVTHLGNSFTSKIPVPAGVDISNNLYWVNTGNYNSQVETYRQDVERLRNEVNSTTQNLTNLINNNAISTRNNYGRKIICIGDSYNVNVPNAWTSWGDQLTAISANTMTVYNYGYGGAGFAYRSTENGKIFEDGLTDALTAISDPNTITDIIVAGGYNDTSTSQAPNNIISAITSFKNTAHTLYPNAKIHVAYLGADCRFNGIQQACFTTADVYFSGCMQSGLSFVPNINYLLLNKSYMFIDPINANSGFHPNNTGTQVIAQLLYAWLGGSTPNVVHLYDYYGLQRFKITNNLVEITAIGNTTGNVIWGQGVSFDVDTTWKQWINYSASPIVWGAHYPSTTAQGVPIQLHDTVTNAVYFAQVAFFDGYLWISSTSSSPVQQFNTQNAYGLMPNMYGDVRGFY